MSVAVDAKPKAEATTDKVSVEALVTPRIAAVVALAAARPDLTLTPTAVKKKHLIEILLASIIDVVKSGFCNPIVVNGSVSRYTCVKCKRVQNRDLITARGLYSSYVEDRSGAPSQA